MRANESLSAHRAEGLLLAEAERSNLLRVNRDTLLRRAPAVTVGTAHIGTDLFGSVAHAVQPNLTERTSNVVTWVSFNAIRFLPMSARESDLEVFCCDEIACLPVLAAHVVDWVASFGCNACVNAAFGNSLA